MEKSVQLVNPWSGAKPKDRDMTWDDIVSWAKDHVSTTDRPDWLKDARKAFKEDDGITLGKMIIGS